MNRALLFLLLVAVVNVVVVLRAVVPRAEKIGLILCQLVLACVAVSGTLSALVAASAAHVDVGTGRCLLACAAGPLAILLVRAPGPPVARLASRDVVLAMVLVVVGLVGEALVVSGELGPWIAAIPAVVVFVVGGLILRAAWQRRSLVTGALARARAEDDAVAAFCLAVAAGGAALSLEPVAWAGPLAVAAALATVSRVAVAPPDRRDLAVVVIGAALMAVVVWPVTGVLPLLVAALCVAVVSGRSLLSTRRSTSSALQPPSSLAPPAGLAGLAPVLDDALLRRPGRPRVMARTPARRLLDAALERAQRAQPQQRGRSPIEVNSVEADADVDGDPSELAEALCTVLDAALRQQVRHPWAKVSVVVRAANQTVSFEINDTAPGSPEGNGPFAVLRSDGTAGEGLSVGLARARLLVERHGGELHARHGPEGSAVQLTLPRRLSRGGVGVA